MRIGLVTDTHIPEVGTELPPELTEALQGVDLILHAGDIYLPSVLDDLERIAPVLAAKGDDDYGATLADSRVKEKHVLTLEGQTIWLVHMRPLYLTSGWWLTHSSTEPDKDSHPDIVVFGHEHRATVQHYYNILFVNSGSPTFLHYRRELGTVGILDLNDGKAEAQIVQLQ